jgi:dephospho-CoA kinase
MDAVVIVSAPAEVRMERVMRRDGISRKEVQARMAAQWSDEQRRPYGTHEVVNDGAMAVIPQVLRLYEQWSGGSIVEP